MAKKNVHKVPVKKKNNTAVLERKIDALAHFADNLARSLNIISVRQAALIKVLLRRYMDEQEFNSVINEVLKEAQGEAGNSGDRKGDEGRDGVGQGS